MPNLFEEDSQLLVLTTQSLITLVRAGLTNPVLHHLDFSDNLLYCSSNRSEILTKLCKADYTHLVVHPLPLIPGDQAEVFQAEGLLLYSGLRVENRRATHAVAMPVVKVLSYGGGEVTAQLLKYPTGLAG